MFQWELYCVEDVSFHVSQAANVVPSYIWNLWCTNILGVGRPDFLEGNIKVVSSNQYVSDIFATAIILASKENISSGHLTYTRSYAEDSARNTRSERSTERRAAVWIDNPLSDTSGARGLFHSSACKISKRSSSLGAC